MKLLITALCVGKLLVAIGTAQVVDGTFTVTESWSVTLEYEDFANGFTGTRNFSGRESATLVIQQGEYRLINRTGFQIQVDDRFMERSINCFGGSCGIDGYYAFGPGYAARAYGLLFLGCFMVKVPLVDGEVPVFHDFDYFSASGPLQSMQGGGMMTGGALRATVSSTLSITPKATPATSPPRITEDPRAVTVDYGRKAVLSVRAAGAPPLTFQWWKDGAPLDGATNAALTLPQATSADAGNYHATVENNFGTVTSGDAVLTVRPPIVPVIKIQPRNKAVRLGRKLKLTSRAKGSPPLAYQWFFNDSAIPGGNTNSFMLPAVQASDAGNYFLVVNNPAGSVTSAVASVVVKISPP